MPAWVNVHSVCTPGTRGTRVMDSYELACGFWELNPSPLQQAPLTTEHLTGHLTPASVLGFCFVLWQMLQWEKNPCFRYYSKNHLLIGSLLGGESLSPRSFCPALQFRPFTPWLCACLPESFQFCPPNSCTVTVFRTILGMALGTGSQLPSMGQRRTLC